MAGQRTRKIVRPEGACNPEQFLAQHRATISIISGPEAGSEYTRGEYVLEWESVSLGRGPGVDFAIDDSCMSRKHAMLELGGNGFQIRDLIDTVPVRTSHAPRLSTVSEEPRVPALFPAVILPYEPDRRPGHRCSRRIGHATFDLPARAQDEFCVRPGQVIPLEA